MKHILKVSAIVMSVIFMAGCETTGLSLREQGNFNYSNFIYGLYDGKSNTAKETKNLIKPVKLAVAQVGENAPPQMMLEKLETKSDLIASVSVIPVGGNISYFYGNDKNQDGTDFGSKMVKMRNLAKDLGADYLFLFGGTSAMGERESWLGIADISIVGAFIFPTHKIVTEGKATGALIDVETGKAVFMVSSQEAKDDYATSFNLPGKQEQVLTNLRDALVSSLADQFIKKLSTM